MTALLPGGSVHPCEKDRLARAAGNETGIVSLDASGASAGSLFADIDALSQAATVRHYEHDLGLVLWSDVTAGNFGGWQLAVQRPQPRFRRRRGSL
jgi:hypothetical protein